MPELCPNERSSYDSMVIEGELQAITRKMTGFSTFVSFEVCCGGLRIKSRIELKKKKERGQRRDVETRSGKIGMIPYVQEKRRRKMDVRH